MEAPSTGCDRAFEDGDAETYLQISPCKICCRPHIVQVLYWTDWNKISTSL